MLKVRKIDVVKLNLGYKAYSDKIMELPYAKAGLRQFARAKADSPNLCNKFFEGKKYREILKNMTIANNDLPFIMRNFDEKGKITEFGILCRKLVLDKFKLSRQSSIRTFFNAEAEASQKKAQEIVQKVHENFDGSYSA